MVRKSKPKLTTPLRHFAKWSDHEWEMLRDEIKGGLDVHTIAKIHNRSKNAIECAFGKTGLLDKSVPLIINGHNYDLAFALVKSLIDIKIRLKCGSYENF